jgi:hypothetical protein
LRRRRPTTATSSTSHGAIGAWDGLVPAVAQPPEWLSRGGAVEASLVDTHWPFMHCPIEQEVPSATGVMLLQVRGSFGVAHKPTPAHRIAVRSVKVTHSVDSPLHAITMHAPSSPDAGAWLHLPLPLHALHVSQACVFPGKAQLASAAHVPAHSPSPVQSRCGSRPVATVQLPIAPARLHAWHLPLHAVLQQTPSAQWPESQSELIVQLCPSARCRPQLALAQWFGDTHRLSSTQLDGQAAKLQ